MKKLIYRLLLLIRNKKVRTRPNNLKMPANAKSFYDFKLKSIDGKEIDFSIYKGKKIMIVNTASACGYTPQYDDLQKLFKQYKDKLIILGFPSNNFGGQEPASNNEIASFCTKNYGVTFPMFEKSDVIGTNQNTLYKWLADKQQNGWNTQSPDWNFCKYLINENGELIKFYSSSVNPLSEYVVNSL